MQLHLYPLLHFPTCSFYLQLLQLSSVALAIKSKQQKSSDNSNKNYWAWRSYVCTVLKKMHLVAASMFL